MTAHFSKLLQGICAVALLLGNALHAQTEQTTPFSVYLDQRGLRAAAEKKVPLPIWLAGVGLTSEKSDPEAARVDVYRFSLRPLGTLAQALLLRVYFQDDPQAQPEVTAWNELGDCIYRAPALGSGLDLPAAAGLILQTAGVSYLEIKVPNGAGNLRGVFLGALKSAAQWTATDFDGPAALHDPFGNQPTAKLPADDTLLFDRVQALLDGETAKLSADEGGAYQFEFQLARVPLAAVITFEIQNADIARPAACAIGETPLGEASYQLPDLADPAYATTQFLGETQPRVRYTGWMRAQIVISGSQLAAAWNRLEISLRHGQEPAALRGLSIQLKYAPKP